MKALTGLVPIWQEDVERVLRREAFLYIYGRIDYKDISSKERYTGFARLYWIPYGPDEPVWKEDFVSTERIPAPYTECT